VSTTAKTLFTILFLLVFISIGLNLYLVWQLQQAQQEVRTVVQQVGPGVQESLTQAIADLETFQNATLEFQVAIDEEFPVAAEIPFDENIEVPINLVVPIQQDIETTIIIDVLGQDLPIDVNVPVDIEIPIDTTISVPISRTIVVSTTVPLQLDVPIAVEIGQSELAGYIDRLRESLISFSEMLDQLMAEVQ
jgi:hypothetical protein